MAVRCSATNPYRHALIFSSRVDPSQIKLENYGVLPDIEIPYPPGSKGDPQILGAVREAVRLVKLNEAAVGVGELHGRVDWAPLHRHRPHWSVV